MPQNIITAGNATSNFSTAAGDDGTFKIVVGPNGSQVDGISVDATGNATVAGGVLSKGTSGLGYGTGAGGTVTQATSKGTAVTLNKLSGQITMNNASLSAGGVVVFAVNNTSMGANDVVALTLGSVGSGLTYNCWCPYSANGVFYVALQNISGGALGEPVQVKFAIIKGATS